MKASLRDSFKKPQVGVTPLLELKSPAEHDMPFDRQSTIQSNRDTLQTNRDQVVILRPMLQQQQHQSPINCNIRGSNILLKMDTLNSFTSNLDGTPTTVKKEQTSDFLNYCGIHARGGVSPARNYSNNQSQIVPSYSKQNTTVFSKTDKRSSDDLSIVGVSNSKPFNIDPKIQEQTSEGFILSNIMLKSAVTTKRSLQSNKRRLPTSNP